MPKKERYSFNLSSEIPVHPGEAQKHQVFLGKKNDRIEMTNTISEGFFREFVPDRILANSPAKEMFFVESIIVDGQGDILKGEIDAFLLINTRFLKDKKLASGTKVTAIARYTGLIPEPLERWKPYLFIISIHGEGSVWTTFDD
jgi:hypothetical protein